MKNWFEELMSRHQRRLDRHPLPRLVVYYWDGSTPVPHEIRDISTSGLFLRTTHRWYPGTLITLTLQRTDKDEKGERPSITVQARVVRSEAEGVGLRFIVAKSEESRRLQKYVAGGVDVQDEDGLRRFLLSVLGRDSPPALS